MRGKNQSDANESNGELHKRRGWGPFSGGQLTIIIVAALVMIGFPVGAFAVVSGTNSFITDASSGKHATVNANGQLATTVNGVIAALPSTFVRSAPTVMVTNTGGCTLLYTAPATRAVVVRTAILDTRQYSGATGTPDLILLKNDPTCANASHLLTTIGAASAGAGQSETHIDPGIVLPAGTSLYAQMINVSVAGSVTTGVNLWGYSLPASACQSPNVCN